MISDLIYVAYLSLYIADLVLFRDLARVVFMGFLTRWTERSTLLQRAVEADAPSRRAVDRKHSRVAPRSWRSEPLSRDVDVPYMGRAVYSSGLEGW